MIPLQTIQGLASEDIKKRVLNRNVFIWGNGILAQIVIRSLSASGVFISGLLDNRATVVGKKIDGYSILDIDEILEEYDNKDIFIIISSSVIMNFAKKYLIKNKLLENKDFISYIKVSRPTAAVDVYSGCNLKCNSCPQGNINELQNIHAMSFENYKKVLVKLLADLPLLSCIELFTWGEPFLNQELPKIISYTKKKKIPTIVSTNLQNIDILEEVIISSPTALYITVTGVFNEYEKRMFGARWDSLLSNLSTLSVLLNQYDSQIIVEIRIYTYKSTSKEKLQEFLIFCKNNNLKFVMCDAYLNPYDNYLSIAQGLDTSNKIKNEVLDNYYDLNQLLNIVKKDILLPCLSQRIFPIINADLSVGLCHTFYNPRIAENFLDISWNELLNIRHNQKQCIECQGHGLHRLDIDVLNKKYTEEINQIREG
jgi:MoaA/NifB/PqqE/SkfB family radical SAM enzyme